MEERKLYVIIPQSCWKLFTPNNYKVDKWCSEYVHKHKHNKPRRANRPNRTEQNKNWNFLMTVVQYIFNWLEAPIDCIFLYFFVCVIRTVACVDFQVRTASERESVALNLYVFFSSPFILVLQPL